MSECKKCNTERKIQQQIDEQCINCGSQRCPGIDLCNMCTCKGCGNKLTECEPSQDGQEYVDFVLDGGF